MKKQSSGRNPLFAKRWFADEVIVTCVRWYLRFQLSYRGLAFIAAECGVSVAPSTILRWVIRYTEEFVERWAPFERAVGRSWRADETYIKVSGRWCYLYCAIDRNGQLIDPLLSAKRDRTAAQHFFRSAQTVAGHRPVPVTTDGHNSYPSAIAEVLEKQVKHCCSRYKNNRMEQDHRGMKQRYYPHSVSKTFPLPNDFVDRSTNCKTTCGPGDH